MLRIFYVNTATHDPNLGFAGRCRFNNEGRAFCSRSAEVCRS